MALSILPRPKKVTERKGTFAFAPGGAVVLSGQADDAERVAGMMLADAAADYGAGEQAVERHGKLDGIDVPHALMLLFGRDEKLCPELRKLRTKDDLGREGYVVDVTPDRVLVAANSSAGLLYGAGTLSQLLRTRKNDAALPCCRIVDWPDFKYRGLMLDVSRFRVPTQQTLINLVMRLAACKINVLQLYIEHTFQCRRHPDYSEGVSPLTAEQLGDLDELCAMLNIELQANQNSLGHMEHVLRQPAYSDLAEIGPDDEPVLRPNGTKFPQPWSFRLDRQAVYDLLDDIYAEHLTAVRSPLVNLGCDEAWDMGGGRSKSLVARKGKVKAFVDHVKKIRDLAAKYGKQTMIWEDMIRNNPEVLGMLPKDVIPVFWHYAAAANPKYMRIWGGSRHRHWMAPGCCSWQSITSQIERAWKNIHWMTSAGWRGGAEGILNTEWGDYGNFQTLAVSYMSIALGGELSWNRKPMKSTADFDKRFARAVFDDATGRMGRLYRLLGETNAVFQDLPYASPPWQLYWDRFPDGTHLVARGKDLKGLDKCEELAEQALTLARELQDDPPPGVEDALFEELKSAAEQTLFACYKTRVANVVRRELARDGKLSARLRGEVKRMAAEWDRQRDEFRRVWLLTNEVSQIDFRLGEYAKRKRDFSRVLKAKGKSKRATKK